MVYSRIMKNKANAKSLHIPHLGICRLFVIPILYDAKTKQTTKQNFPLLLQFLR